MGDGHDGHDVAQFLRTNLKNLMFKDNPQLLSLKIQPPGSHLKNKTCALCGKTGPVFQRCSVCKSVNYCGPKHQRDHWKSHKKSCKAWVGGESELDIGLIEECISLGYERAEIHALDEINAQRGNTSGACAAACIVYRGMLFVSHV